MLSSSRFFLKAMKIFFLFLIISCSWLSLIWKRIVQASIVHAILLVRKKSFAYRIFLYVSDDGRTSVVYQSSKTFRQFEAKIFTGKKVVTWINKLIVNKAFWTKIKIYAMRLVPKLIHKFPKKFFPEFDLILTDIWVEYTFVLFQENISLLC